MLVDSQNLTNYLPRVVDDLLAKKLASSGGVIVEGPKACGKTATALRQAGTSHFVDIDANFRQLFEISPQLALNGQPPVLLDEWQTIPELWNFVRREIDTRQQAGQYILSGSATPTDNIKGHSGLGRFSHLRMRPMTGHERQIFPGGISFQRLLSGQPLEPTRVADFAVLDLFEAMIHGGWPADHSASTTAASDHVADYVERLTTFDVFEIADSRIRRPLGARTLLRSIARNVGQAPSIATLTTDVISQDGGVDRETVRRWLEALQRLFVVDSVPAWNPKLRSKATIRTSPVVYLTDSSLVANLLGATVDSLVRDLGSAGFIFKNYVYQQIATYAERIGAKIMHYRDSNGKEFDAVLVLNDGTWVGIETKLGSHWIDNGISSLVSTSQTIDIDSLGAPRALLLIVGGSNLAYTDKESGVSVVPVQALEA